MKSKLDEEKFKLAVKARELYYYIVKNTVTMPKIYSHIKNTLLDESLDFLRNVHGCNGNTIIDLKVKYIDKAILNLKIIQNELLLCEELNILTKKQLIRIFSILTDSMKLTKGWYKYFIDKYELSDKYKRSIYDNLYEREKVASASKDEKTIQEIEEKFLEEKEELENKKIENYEE